MLDVQVPASAGDGLKSPLMGMLEKPGALEFPFLDAIPYRAKENETKCC